MKKLDEAPLKKEEREAVDRAAHLLKKQYPVEKVILFGSKARGDADEYSDLDLLVITSQPLHWKKEREIIEALFDMGIQYDVLFSPLFASLEEWEHGVFRSFPIYEQINDEGAVVA